MAEILQSLWSKIYLGIHVSLCIAQREQEKKQFFEKEKCKVEWRAWSSIHEVSTKGKKKKKRAMPPLKQNHSFIP